jgi:hypothetical protein
VALVEPQCALVLRGGIPVGRMPAPYDFTWAFVLRAGPGGSTRLVVRERYGYLRRWAPLVVEPAELISFVMSQRMLRSIRSRAERASLSAPSNRGRVLPGRRASRGYPMTPARDSDRDGRTMADWENRLRGDPSDKVFSSAELEGLPEPVRRYLRTAIVPGTPLAECARLRSHKGRPLAAVFGPRGAQPARGFHLVRPCGRRHCRLRPVFRRGRRHGLEARGHGHRSARGCLSGPSLRWRESQVRLVRPRAQVRQIR